MIGRVEEIGREGTGRVWRGTDESFERATINFLREKMTLQLFETPPDVTCISTDSDIRSFLPLFSTFLDFLSIKILAD
jgi:hypothetical protein